MNNLLNRGMIRLIASILLFAFIVPLVILPGVSFSDPHELWLELLSLIPFSHSFVKVITSAFTEAASGSHALLEYIAEQDLTMPQYIATEAAETVFTSVVLMLLTYIIGKEFSNSKERGICNKLANCIFQIMLTFAATRITEYVYTFYNSQVRQLTETAQNLFIYGYSAILGTSSVVILIVAGILFLNTFVIIGINCLKLLLSYIIAIWCVLCYMQGGHLLGILAGFTFWILLLCILLYVENLFSPNN